MFFVYIYIFSSIYIKHGRNICVYIKKQKRYEERKLFFKSEIRQEGIVYCRINWKGDCYRVILKMDYSGHYNYCNPLWFFSTKYK